MCNVTGITSQIETTHANTREHAQSLCRRVLHALCGVRVAIDLANEQRARNDETQQRRKSEAKQNEVAYVRAPQRNSWSLKCYFVACFVRATARWDVSSPRVCATVANNKCTIIMIRCFTICTSLLTIYEYVTIGTSATNQTSSR